MTRGEEAASHCQGPWWVCSPHGGAFSGVPLTRPGQGPRRPPSLWARFALFSAAPTLKAYPACRPERAAAPGEAARSCVFFLPFGLIHSTGVDGPPTLSGRILRMSRPGLGQTPGLARFEP